MKNIVYIKKVDSYNDILKEKYHKIPIVIKKIIYMYKNMFNIITKKKIENEDLWILPLQEKYSTKKINNIIRKIARYKENTYVISSDFGSFNIYNLLDNYGILYLKGENLKKYLSIKILEYINNIRNEEISNVEVSILVNDINQFNVYIIEKLSKLVKSIKVVSPNIYKLKNVEEKLYNEYGIAIQFSNSYKKSLSKSKYIINLDYNKIDINEYEIFSKAIIINSAEDNIKIKSKLFNGIIVNSCNIKFKKEIRDKFRKMNIYNKHNSLVLYESNIKDERNLDKVFEGLQEDKVMILDLIGNNGTINKNEFKNILKKLDK